MLLVVQSLPEKGKTKGAIFLDNGPFFFPERCNWDLELHREEIACGAWQHSLDIGSWVRLSLLILRHADRDRELP